MIYSVVLVSGVQQSESAIHLNISTLRFFSHVGHHRVLSRVPSRFLLVIFFFFLVFFLVIYFKFLIVKGGKTQMANFFSQSIRKNLISPFMLIFPPVTLTVIRVINYMQLCRSVVLTKGMRRKEEHISSFFKKLRIPSPPNHQRTIVILCFVLSTACDNQFKGMKSHHQLLLKRQGGTPRDVWVSSVS